MSEAMRPRARAHRSADPGRGRVRPLAAGLAAFAALLALPLQAQAQTVVTLVNSSNQTAGQSSTALGNHWEIAQGFTTGSNTYGYTLTNIRAVFPQLGSTPSLTVTLHEDAPTNAAIATLTNPATLEYGQLTFTAPANTTLDASTTYYVLFHGENIFLQSTTSDDEDTNGLSDWSVEDVRYRRDDRTTGAFTEVAVSTPIRVRGTVRGTDATLSDLELEDNTGTAITLTPTFVTGTTSYTASVVSSVSAITLTPTVNESGATVAYLNASDAAITDTDTTTPALDAPLVVGANTFKVKVTAENTTTTETYTVVVTRAVPPPTVSISADTDTAVFKEDAIVYTLTRTGSTTAALPVTVALTQTKDFLLPAELSKTVTIAVGQSTKTFTVAASSFQQFAAGTMVEAGTLTATVQDGTDYDLGASSAVDVAIVIGVTVRIEVASSTVGEAAGTLSVKLIGRTGPGAPQPTSNTSSLTFSSANDTAVNGIDYNFSSAGQQFFPSEFSMTSGVWEAEDSFDLTITNDEDDEDDESFILKLEYHLGHRNTPLVDASGDSCGDACEVTVTIVDDDGSNPPASPPALSIADASAAENAGHLLFDVTLSRSLPNTVKVDFETISGGTATEGVDYHARRTYTHVILAGDKTAQMGFALIEDTVAAAGETVQVRLSNARVVDAYGDKIKDLDITRAEATGTITAPPTTTTPVPGLTIRIRDATGDEDSGWLDFRVRLSRKHDDYVCYDFETISGGTATEGMDYLKIPKATYWMQIGKRVDKPFVRLIDDSVNDNGETVKVKISNAHLCDDASQTVSITRAEATGTIRNSDPLPRALMARFGRTAAVHVVEHVEERLAAPREVGVEAQVAGRQLRPGMARALALDVLSQLGSSAGMHAPGAGSPGARSGSPMGAAAGSIGLAAGRGGPAGGGMGVAADPMNGMAGPAGGLFDRGLRSMGLGGEHLLTRSSFALTRETRQGGILSFWSRGARSSFAGREEALSLGGDVRTTMVGADYAKGPLVTGLSLSNSRGLGEYAGVTGGQVASAVTGLYPWLGYTLSDRVSVWGVTGYGKGALTLTPGEGAALTSGLSMAMAAAGTRGALVAGGASGFELTFKADALWVGTSIDGVEGPGGNLAATATAVTRFRTGLEAARGYALAGRLSLRPSVEVGLRHDGGDAETGAGLDVGGGLVVSDTSTGLAVDLRVRMLAMHQADGFRERGMALSLSYNPTPRTPLGLTARVAPSWGGQATSGAEALWGRETMAGLAQHGGADGTRLEAEIGYGLPVSRRFVGTPTFGVGTSEMGRDYRLGYGLTVAQDGALDVELGVDAHRRERSRLGEVDTGVLGRAALRW